MATDDELPCSALFSSVHVEFNLTVNFKKKRQRATRPQSHIISSPPYHLMSNQLASLPCSRHLLLSLLLTTGLHISRLDFDQDAGAAWALRSDAEQAWPAVSCNTSTRVDREVAGQAAEEGEAGVKTGGAAHLHPGGSCQGGKKNGYAELVEASRTRGVVGRGSQMERHHVQRTAREAEEEDAWFKRDSLRGRRMSPIVSCQPSVENSPMTVPITSGCGVPVDDSPLVSSSQEGRAQAQGDGGEGARMDPVAVSVAPLQVR